MAKNTLENKATHKLKNEKKTKVKKSNRSFVKLISGDFLSKDELVKNLPFLSFVALLMVVMIGWGYYTESIGKVERKLEKELGELNSEYFTLGSEYNRLSRQSQVAERLKGSGLKESVRPPKKLTINKYVFK